MIYDGVEYEFIRGSDIVRDGMFLELNKVNTNPLEQLAEVFYSDISHQFSLSYAVDNIPLPVIEKLIELSKQLLPEIEDIL